MEISKQQDCSMTRGCSLQINSRTPLLRKMPTQLIEHVEVELMSARDILVSLVWKGTLQALKEKHDTNPKPFT